MKTINLNIKIDDLIFGSGIEEEKLSKLKGFELAKKYIELAFTIYQSQPDGRGIPKGMSISDQRKTYKIIGTLEKSKDKLELEDDRFEFLYRIFNEVKWVGGTKIVVRIADRMEEAKEVKIENNKKNA